MLVFDPEKINTAYQSDKVLQEFATSIAFTRNTLTLYALRSILYMLCARSSAG
ncbi:hypothetical protein GO684_01590 [Wolbachia endosymbiont of Litomosoides brasiliensis]|nr:hypothetical protein [Wolbachia endosymbiont of Litomosoides brasiliensis]